VDNRRGSSRTNLDTSNLAWLTKSQHCAHTPKHTHTYTYDTHKPNHGFLITRHHNTAVQLSPSQRPSEPPGWRSDNFSVQIRAAASHLLSHCQNDSLSLNISKLGFLSVTVLMIDALTA